MGRFGERGADYSPGLGKSRRNLPDMFSVQANGYSFTFAHNFKSWKTFTEDMKREVLKAAVAEVKQTLRMVGIEAIKRCPHYSGALEHAIKVTLPEVTGLGPRGRITGSVGVLNSWRSSYDEIAEPLGFPTSSPELAVYLHEYYDSFIHSTTFGLKRKRRKEGVVGRRVGSGFLSRAWHDNAQHNNLVAGIAKRVMQYNAQPIMTNDEIEADLEREADSITGSMGND